MSIALRVLMVAISVVFIGFVVRLVGKGRLLLRYSLTWLALGLVCLLCSLFPEIVYAISGLVGFVTPSNFILVIGLLLLLVVALSLTAVVSRLSTANKNLVQRVALLEKTIEFSRGDSLRE